MRLSADFACGRRSRDGRKRPRDLALERNHVDRPRQTADQRRQHHIRCGHTLLFPRSGGVMKRVLMALVLAGVPCAAQEADRSAGADPWFSTFSIIAFDPATGELGVGVQSRAFAAGAAVPFAKPGVGAVATQASANRSYGPKAIALLEQGLS